MVEPETKAEKILENSLIFDPVLEQTVRFPQHLLPKVAAAVSEIGLPIIIPAAEHNAPEYPASPSAPVLMFINSRSGGHMGPALIATAQKLVGVAQVYDLSAKSPGEIIKAVTECLRKTAEEGDPCAQDCLDRLRIMVAGGDGTVGWMLSSIMDIEHPPPLGVFPLGTGNDLSRSYGWGPVFASASVAQVREWLLAAVKAVVHPLDSWRIAVLPPDMENLELPRAMLPQQHIPITPDQSPEASAFVGNFYNYFSIGMDASITYAFHDLRERKPWLARGRKLNKMIYSTYGCTQGWFCTGCSAQPQKASVTSIATIQIQKKDGGTWEELFVPPTIRAVIVLNLQSYGGGRDPWGKPKPPKEGEVGGRTEGAGLGWAGLMAGCRMGVGQSKWVEATTEDGLLEVAGLHDGWHTAVMMSKMSNATRLAQACGVRLELRRAVSSAAFMQLDGEPWKQPLMDSREPTVVEITRNFNKALLLVGPKKTRLSDKFYKEQP